LFYLQGGGEIGRPQMLRAVDAKRPQQIEIGGTQTMMPTDPVQIGGEDMTDIERVPNRREIADVQPQSGIEGHRVAYVVGGAMRHQKASTRMRVMRVVLSSQLRPTFS